MSNPPTEKLAGLSLDGPPPAPKKGSAKPPTPPATHGGKGAEGKLRQLVMYVGCQFLGCRVDGGSKT